jgi:hypothetical protein
MTSELTFRRDRAAAVVALVLALSGLFLNDTVLSQTPPAGGTQPGALKDGWDAIDQRLVFLTVQLSTVESSIDATNKALRINGYQQSVRQEAADRARAGNERMDRNGGGPVSWKEFYGKTAERFFYHPTDDNTGYLNPVPVDQRPPQFDYIYRANEQNQAAAEADVNKIGTKIDDLLSYRRHLESEQSALWARIAFRGTSSLDIDSRPMYRMDLATKATDDASKQSVAAAKAGTAFLSAVDAELTDAQKNLDGDQKGTLDHLLQTTTSERAALQEKLLQLPAIAAELSSPRSPIGQFDRAARRMEDSAQNTVDAYGLAADCDAHDDNAGKQIYRGQLQQMLLDYASTVSTADQSLTAAVADWKLTMVAGKPVAAAPSAAASSPADIPGRLEDAKAQHEKDVATARRGLLAAIDTRLNAAADAGDLPLAQSMQAAKLKAAENGTIPDDVTDPAILDAKKQMTQSIQAADGRLAAAYHQAIVDYTKARMFTEAQAVQDEMNGAGLSTAAPAGPGAALPQTRLFADRAAGEVMKLTGHVGPVTDLRLTADGRSILSCGEDGTVRLWDLSTGKEIHRFEAGDGPVLRLSEITSSGHFLAVSEHGSAVVWDMNSGEEVYRFTHEDFSSSGALSPDGKLAIITDNTHPTLVCSTVNGEAVRDFQGEGQYASAWCPNGRVFATGGWNKVVVVYNAATLKEVRRFHQQGQVYGLTFSADGRRLLSSEGEKTAHLWDLDTGREIRKIHVGVNPLRSLALSDDGSLAVVPGDDTVALVYDMATGAVRARLEGHSKRVTGVAVSGDGRLAATCSEDETIRIWKLATAVQRAVAPASDRVRGIARTVDLLALVRPSDDAVSGTWTLRSGRLLSDDGDMSRIQFPYHPPAEYDFRIQFVRNTGDGDVSQIAVKGGHAFRWAMAAFDNRVCGFETIDNVNCWDSPTSAKKDAWFANGKSYVVVVKVREQSVQATIDGEPISEWKTDDAHGAVNPFPLDDREALGVATYRSRVTFTKIEVDEISGPGEVVARK